MKVVLSVAAVACMAIGLGLFAGCGVIDGDGGPVVNSASKKRCGSVPRCLPDEVCVLAVCRRTNELCIGISTDCPPSQAFDWNTCECKKKGGKKK